MAVIRVQADDFDPGEALSALGADCRVGGIASFVGTVRSDPARPLAALTIEQYPAMTGASIGAIAAEAEARFGLLGCVVIHRFGRLEPGSRIVLAAAAAAHRAAALEATGFLIDWLKTAAPFWKKEHLADGTEHWVDARRADDVAASRWK